jgi:hypothetical protein
VVNDYFSRSSLPGRYHVEVIDGLEPGSEVRNSFLMPHNGFANWSFELPDEAAIGSTFTVICTVADDLNPEGFTNTVKLTVLPYSEHEGGRGQRKNRSEGGASDGREDNSGIQMPNVVRVRESMWAEYKFDRNSACRVIPDEVGEGVAKQVSYTFYINVDNIFLRTDMKKSKEDPKVVEAKFLYGNVLIGLAMIQDSLAREKFRNGTVGIDEEQPAEKDVERVSRALAPFIVPMIDSLGAITAEDVASLGQVGDDE